MGLCLWDQFIQAITMIPVFIIHSIHLQKFTAQSLIGMIHSVFSYLLHFHIWWQQQGEWPLWSIELYALDKSFILFLVWGYHYHSEPVSAKIMAVPCILNTYQIVSYQHQYIHTRCAYFDVFLQSYIIYVYLNTIVCHTKTLNAIMLVLILSLSMLGFYLEIPGFMHMMLVPKFWLLYDYIDTRHHIHSIR